MLVIDGERRLGSGDPYPVLNPARPAEVVGGAPTADRADLDRAVAAARAALAGWAGRPLAERVRLVGAAAGAASAAAERTDLGALLTREHGKLVAEARFETQSVAAIAALMGAMADEALADRPADPAARYPLVRQDPYGVVGIILPFNWPVAVLAMKVTPALLAGNTVVVKAPPTCPLAVLTVAAEMAAQLPRGVLNMVNAAGAELGAALVDHPGVDLVSLTGGLRTGQAVMAGAARRLAPVLLELGGNDPAILAPDVTVDEALADRLLQAAFSTSGQVCLAIKRLYVPADRLDDTLAALVARCEATVVGDGLADEVTMGPLHTAAAVDRVGRLLVDAEQRGAKVHRAGRLRPAEADAGGHFVLPAIVADPPPDAAVVREEQFAPVLPVLGYRALDDAVTAANDSEFGLTASVWSRDEDLLDQVSRRLAAGTVFANAHGMAAMDPRVPFGGWRRSGIGRELGPEGIRAYTQSRAFVRHPL